VLDLHGEHVPVALLNPFRMLRTGGIFRLVVPDLGWRTTNTSARAAPPRRHRPYITTGTCAPAPAASCDERGRYCAEYAQWMCDEPLMTKLLAVAGLIDVRRSSFEDPAFAQVGQENAASMVAIRSFALQCRGSLEAAERRQA
jgi:hypothetical protein